MQENNFEKQVKQLMDDLRMNPSEPVWEYVEKRIPKSNRRRRFIALFLLFIGLTICGYFFYNKKAIIGNSVTNNNKTEAIKTEKNILHQQTEDATKTEQPISKVPTSEEENKKAASTISVSKNSSQTITSITNKYKINNSKKKFIDGITNNETLNAEEDNKETVVVNNEKQPQIKKETSKIDLLMNDEIKQPAKTNETENKEDSIATALKTFTDSAATSLNTYDAVTAKKELKKPNNNYKKLQWGFSGFYGRSDMIEGFGIFNSNKSLANNISATPGTDWDSAASLSYSKDIKAKTAFSLGFAIKKQISKRSSISAGVQYLHISTQIRTGELKDSSANFNYNNSNITTHLENFYRAGLSVIRKNKYNLIQIPLRYSYQFNNSKQLPLFIDAGFSLTRIISSDALVYDSYNQAYYENPNLFNKTQVTITGGLHTNISFLHNGTLEIGPQLQYGLTNMIKNSDAKQHLFIWGFSARYFIMDKK